MHDPQTTNLDDYSRSNLFSDLYTVIIKATGDQPISYQLTNDIIEMLENNEWIAHD
jgi:hypothetical protein